MAASAPVFALFVWYERVKERRDGSPLVPLRLFRERGFSAGMAIAVTFFLGIASFGLVLTLFLQLGLGFTPLHAGLTFLPFSAGRAGLLRRGRPAGAPVRPRRHHGRRARSSPPGMAGIIVHRAPLRAGGDDLGARAEPGRGRPRPGRGDRAAGRHRAGPGAEAGRGLGVRGVQHRPPARQLDRHRGDRRDLLRDARQPVRPGRQRRRASAALRRRGRRGPGPATPGRSRPSSASACTTGWSPPTRRSPRRPASPGRPRSCAPAAQRALAGRGRPAPCGTTSPPRWSGPCGSRSACSCSASCSCSPCPAGPDGRRPTRRAGRGAGQELAGAVAHEG